MPSRKRLLAGLVALIATPSFAANLPKDAEAAYQAARHGYYALKADEGRRKFRHNWLNVVNKFEAVATKFPKSDRAPDALFTAGQTLEELSRISRVDEDLAAAIADYQKLIDANPKHRLADDAGYELARIELDRLSHPDEARKFAQRALDAQPKGDRAKELKALLESLPEDKKAAVAKAPPAVKVAEPQKSKSAEVEKGDSEAVTASGEPTPGAKLALVAAIEKLARSPQPIADARAEKKSAAAESPSAKPPANLEEQDDSPRPEEHVHADEAPVAKTDAKDREVAAKDGKPDVTPHAHPGFTVGDEVDSGAARHVDVALAPEKATPPSLDSVDPKVAKARLKAVGARDPEITLAEQLGLKVRRVVIDAGHGGHDSGAIGPSGALEKDVSLAIAKKLAKELQRAGLEVVMTRDDDTFVRLEDRANLANEAHGDLFISVHCNSATTHKLHGIEVYTLNTAADRYSIRLAARENASSEKSISDLQFILADLATKANTDESSNLATRVEGSLVNRLSSKYKNVKGLGHKQALFYVLLGTRMPAILVETSFLSNPEEEKRLTSDEYQSDVAQSIAAGVQEFLGNRDRLAKMD